MGGERRREEAQGGREIRQNESRFIDQQVGKLVDDKQTKLRVHNTDVITSIVKLFIVLWITYSLLIIILNCFAPSITWL